MTPMTDGQDPPSSIEELLEQLGICTGDEDCRAEANEHEPDCPVEQRLRQDLGF